MKKPHLISLLYLVLITGCTLKQDPSFLDHSHAIQQEALSAHNHWRSLHHAPDLIWDNQLAEYAQRHANKCWFKHSSSPYGENLAEGYPNITAVTQAWYDEQSQYSYHKPGFSVATGHFTQVIWKSSKKLGCAYTDCYGKHGTLGIFWVCEYSPHGNVVNPGYFEKNVLPD